MVSELTSLSTLIVLYTRFCRLEKIFQWLRKLALTYTQALISSQSNCKKWMPQAKLRNVQVMYRGASSFSCRCIWKIFWPRPIERQIEEPQRYKAMDARVIVVLPNCGLNPGKVLMMIEYPQPLVTSFFYGNLLNHILVTCHVWFPVWKNCLNQEDIDLYI